MINLIKNELYKIFKKKTIFIILLITLGFVIFNNAIYKLMNNNKIYDDIYIKNIKEEIKTIDIDSNKEYYSNLSSDIEIYDLKKQYGLDSWQAYIIDNDLANIIYEKNSYKYVEIDNEKYKEKEKELNKYIDLLNDKNWKVYSVYRLNEYKNELNNLKKQNLNKEIYEVQESFIKDKIERLELRLDKNIEYKNDYINQALNSYISETKDYESYCKDSMNELKDSFDESKCKIEYKSYIEENEKYKYAIENNVEIENVSTSRYGIVNFISEYSLFILIISIVVSGNIVSTEFDKGTIKLLLVRPYNRTKILLSKYISSLFIILLSIISIFIMQFIVSGIFYGYSSLNIPQIIYNFNTNSIQYINIFKYSILETIATLPKFVLLTTLGFTISTIINNSIVGVAIPIVGYFAAEIINVIIQSYSIKLLKYFITPNWNFTPYLFGGISEFSGITFIFSLIICTIYLLILIIPTFIIFNKKNIKNI